MTLSDEEPSRECEHYRTVSRSMESRSLAARKKRLTLQAVRRLRLQVPWFRVSPLSSHFQTTERIIGGRRLVTGCVHPLRAALEQKDLEGFVSGRSSIAGADSDRQITIEDANRLQSFRESGNARTVTQFST